MKKISFLAIFFSCILAMSGAVNPIKEARKNMKNARYEENGNEARKVHERLANTEKMLLEALQEEKNAKKRAELYYTAALVQRKFNDIENEKIYLKRAYDTALYYNSIYKLYQYMEQCDSAETLLLPKKRKFRAKGRKELLNNRANLLNGGRFYIEKKDYAGAYRILDLYLSSAEYPMLEKDSLHQNDTMFVRAAYWAVISAYYAGIYAGTVRYAPVALRYNKDKEYIQEYVCRSHLALNDSAAWMASLKTGMLNFPEHTYFFSTLVSALNEKGRYDDALAYIDRMIRYDSKSGLFWHAKALTCMLKENYDNCISACDVILSTDAMNTEANLYKGISFCRKAKYFSGRMEKEALGSSAYKKYKQEMTACYEKARVPIENVRKKQPQEAKRWAPLLYQIYLNLNKGAEFAEMDSMMKKITVKGE